MVFRHGAPGKTGQCCRTLTPRTWPPGGAKRGQPASIARRPRNFPPRLTRHVSTAVRAGRGVAPGRKDVNAPPAAECGGGGGTAALYQRVSQENFRHLVAPLTRGRHSRTWITATLVDRGAKTAATPCHRRRTAANCALCAGAAELRLLHPPRHDGEHYRADKIPGSYIHEVLVASEPAPWPAQPDHWCGCNGMDNKVGALQPRRLCRSEIPLACGANGIPCRPQPAVPRRGMQVAIVDASATSSSRPAPLPGDMRRTVDVGNGISPATAYSTIGRCAQDGDEVRIAKQKAGRFRSRY